MTYIRDLMVIQNLLNIIFVLILIMLFQSGHNFALATTAVACAQLWPDYIITFHIKLQDLDYELMNLL